MVTRIRKKDIALDPQAYEELGMPPVLALLVIGTDCLLVPSEEGYTCVLHGSLYRLWVRKKELLRGVYRQSIETIGGRRVYRIHTCTRKAYKTYSSLTAKGKS